MINEFKFQQVIHRRRVYTSIAILLDALIVIWSKKPDICHNGGRKQHEKHELTSNAIKTK